MEKREHPRMEIPDLQADISDGKGFYTGTVKNISRFGLAISDIPRNIDKTSDIYSVILDGPGTHFKLLVRPVWDEDDGAGKTIGAQIENSPWTWTEYVMRQESVANDRFSNPGSH